ncbi:unnamed protein product [Nezara viridula]|uniref:Uncharacterized protein n=1 Tax=Nezara viridula TaxID=85310 RepID=A0A9P0EAK9_NEZVI|nr:unnamed protein product [Nezara viridula]
MSSCSKRSTESNSVGVKWHHLYVALGTSAISDTVHDDPRLPIARDLQLSPEHPKSGTGTRAVVAVGLYREGAKKKTKKKKEKKSYTPFSPPQQERKVDVLPASGE